VWTGVLSLAVLGAILLQVLALGSGLVSVFSGLVLVIGGTLLMARVSHSEGALRGLKDALRDLRAQRNGAVDNDETTALA
jgi:hypothetical protein